MYINQNRHSCCKPWLMNASMNRMYASSTVEQDKGSEEKRREEKGLEKKKYFNV